MNENGDFDIIGKVKELFKKKPFTVLSILSGPVFIFLVAIMAIAAFLMPVIAVANFFSDSTSAGPDVTFDLSDYDEQAQKCIIEYGIKDPTSAAGKTTIEYCKALYDVVVEYKDRFGVSVDPMMITATLFYGRNYGDYTNYSCQNEETGDDPNPTCEPAEVVAPDSVSDWFSDPEYNKKAKKYIKTLASFMLLKTITNHGDKCSDTPKYEINPQTIKEVAFKEWDLLDALGQLVSGRGFDGASKREITDIQAYLDEPEEPQSCPYEDDEPKYLAKYNDSDDYSTFSADYNTTLKNCGGNASSQSCQTAFTSLNNRNQALFQPWAQKGIVNDPIGSPSVSFNCPYPRIGEYQGDHDGGQMYKDEYANYYYYHGCAEMPFKIDSYSVDYSREGLYYYKLMAPMQDFWGKLIPWFSANGIEDSFISKYYDYIVKNDEGTITEENVQEVVDGIYELYETVMGALPTTYEELGLSFGSGLNVNIGDFAYITGDWATWKQGDAAWANVSLGGATLGNVGCAVTSLAKIIAMSGASSTFVGPGEFNPGTFATAWNNRGGFSSGGAVNSWASVSSVVPGIHCLGARTGDLNTIKMIIAEELRNGHYVILRVKENQHWCAVVGTANNDVIINDPSFGTTLPLGQSSYYSNTYKIVVFST